MADEDASSDMQMSDSNAGVDSDVESTSAARRARATPIIYSEDDGESEISPPSSPHRRRQPSRFTPMESSEGEQEQGYADEEFQDEPEDMDEAVAPSASGLKIKLKLHGPAKASPQKRGGRAPRGGVVAVEENVAPARGKNRRAIARVIHSDVEVESEDEDNDTQAEASTSGRQMTARQAVLASVVDSTHVSLLPEAPTRKKHLTETEAALRKEETARKRKNMSEKKLEDEKAETINRLLKKKSKPAPGRARGKPGPKPKLKPSTSASARSSVMPDQADEDEAADDNEADAATGQAGETETMPEVVPLMYRWVSSSRTLPNDDMVVDGADKPAEKKEMNMSFSVPVHIMRPIQPPPQVILRTTPPCDFPGCALTRKYRLVKDWEKGACGMEHLNALKVQLSA